MQQREGGTSTPGSRRTPAHCRTIAIEIVKLYISLLAQFFTLSDVAVATSPNAATVPATFLPVDSNSLTTCYFTGKILTEIVDCTSEIEGLGIASQEDRSTPGTASSTPEAKNVLKNFVESARWRFEEVICETWSNGELGRSGRLANTDFIIFPKSDQTQRFSSISRHGNSIPKTERPPLIFHLLRSARTTT